MMEAISGWGSSRSPSRSSDGKIPLPVSPGLGIEVDEDGLRARASDGRWTSPSLRHDDGSVADW